MHPLMLKVNLCFVLLCFLYYANDLHEIYYKPNLREQFQKHVSATKPGLELIPERAVIVYLNSKYIANSTLSVRRYARRSGYVVNVWGITKHVWANNITVDVVLYEFLHNEYKRSFVEFHFKLCDLVNKDEFLGTILRAHKLKCPFPAGYIGLTNVTMAVTEFPFVMPFKKFKAGITLYTEPSHEHIGTSDLYLSVK